MNTGLGVLSRELILFCALVFSSRTLRVKGGGFTTDSEKNPLYQLCCILSFFQLVFYILSSQIHIFNRLANLLSPAYIFIVPCLYHSKSKYRKLALLFIICMMFLLYVVTLAQSSSDLSGGLGLTPYRSIFNK